MKSFFRRLSSKKEKQKESNFHRSPSHPNWPSVSRKSLQPPVSSINPTFSDFHQHSTQPDQQHRIDIIQQDHDQSEAVSFSNDSIAGIIPDSTPPPSPEAQLPTTPRQRPVDLSSGNTTSKASKPPSPYRSANKLPSNLAPVTALQQVSSSIPQPQPQPRPQPQHVAPSIYKSYNDFDIMSSGRFDFDDNPLLSSAPSADWLTVDDRPNPVDRLPHRPRTADDASHTRTPFRQHWDAKSVFVPSTQQQQPVKHAAHSSKTRPNIPCSTASASPEGSSRSSIAPYSGPLPMHLMKGTAVSPMEATIGNFPARSDTVQGNSPPMQQMVTPFAKYATQSMSQPLFSEDLDTAMRPHGHMPPYKSKELLQDRRLSGPWNGQAAFPASGRRLSGSLSVNGRMPSEARAASASTRSPVRMPTDGNHPPAAMHSDLSQLHARLANSTGAGPQTSPSRMRPQGSWASEAPPRRLEQEFGHAGQLAPPSTTGNSWHPADGSAKASMNDNGQMPANGVGQTDANGNAQMVANGQTKMSADENERAETSRNTKLTANGRKQMGANKIMQASDNGLGQLKSNGNGIGELGLSPNSSSNGFGPFSRKGNDHSPARLSPHQRQLSGKQSEAAVNQIGEAQRQIEQALQTADQQIEALKARVTKKNAQLSDAKLQLEHLREDIQDAALSQRTAPPSLPDTESSEQTELAAAEMQLLRQALDKLQAETQVLDDELARAREQAIFSELERAELSHELETVSAQLLASQTSKAELEETISKLLSDVQTTRSHRRQPSHSRLLLKTDSFRSHPSSPRVGDNDPNTDSNIFSSQQNMGRTASNLMRTVSFATDYKDVVALESEIEVLKFELEETKQKMEAEVAKAREEALGVMRATGDADAEVKKLLDESAELKSSQQEAEASLEQSQQAIHELQAALKNAQAAMATDRLERQQALNTIAQLKEQHRQLQSEQQEADRMSQHIFQLDNQVAGLAASNDELSTDLGRALDVAQRVMEQKQALQEQVKVQEQQLTQWQAEGHRVKELEGFAEEALTALEAQTLENSRLRQQIAAAAAVNTVRAVQ